MIVNRVEASDRFAEMWRTSREDAGRSQEYMAKALGVSKKTIQNWEAGTSCPNQLMGFLWFRVLGLQPLPYYLKLLYPEFESDLRENEQIDKALCAIIKDLPPEAKAKLLYILSGEHGSSAVSIVEMIIAHLQTPMRDRLNIAQCIQTNYSVAKATGKIRNCDQVQPSTDTLREAIQEAEASIISGKEGYTIM